MRNHRRQMTADLVPSPETRRPLSYQTFLEDLLPPILCYYATAVLVTLPNTILIRLALLPVTLWTLFRACTTVDLVKSLEDDRLIYWNHGLLLVFGTMAMRVIAWTFPLQPYERARASQKVACDDEDKHQTPSSVLSIARDASDLITNLRGSDWDWSTGLQLPPETRHTLARPRFILQTLASAVWHIILLDNAHYGVQSFSPTTIGSSDGGTIFDMNLEPVPRYFRSSAMCLIAGFTIYSAMQTAYDILTIIGVLIFAQHPEQWPPLFHSPWKATSLNEFWTRRWHQLFRHQFISVGGKPMFFLLGRVGAVMGVFLMSGIFHHIGLWGMGRGSDFAYVGGYFLMMGVGVVLEAGWKKVTDSKVQGWVGWVWTMLWVVGWANILVDEWSRRGLVGSMFMPTSMRPSTYLLASNSFPRLILTHAYDLLLERRNRMHSRIQTVNVWWTTVSISSLFNSYGKIATLITLMRPWPQMRRVGILATNWEG
ncbi:wax synthase family protein [Pleurotus pulmonarius]